MSVSHHAVRPEDQPRFWTLDGLAAEFGFSTYQIRKYIENGHVPSALGKHPNGLNYNHTHYRELASIRAEREALRLLSQSVRVRLSGRPHCVTVRRETQGVT